MNQPELNTPIKEISASSDATKWKLIEAGLKVFGKYGYEAATTRMLAKSAGVNLAAIPYHFGGKESLYHAVIQYIAKSVVANLAKEREQLLKVLDNQGASREELLATLEAVIRGFIRIVISSQLGAVYGPIIIREQMHPSSAFEIFFNSAMNPLHQGVARLVGRLTGCDAEAPLTIIRTHTILGQVIGFRAAREVALRRLGWENYNPENAQQVCDVIVENIRHTLNGIGEMR